MKRLTVAVLLIAFGLINVTPADADTTSNLQGNVKTMAEVGLLVELKASSAPIMGELSGRPAESDFLSNSHFELYANGNVLVTIDSSNPHHTGTQIELPTQYYIQQSFQDAATGEWERLKPETLVGGSSRQYFIPAHTLTFFYIDGKVTMPDNFWDYQSGNYQGVVVATVTAPTS